MRKLIMYPSLALFLVLTMPSVEANEHDGTLVLRQFWTLSGASNLQPSGLSFCGPELVMVSDRHSYTVFSIPLNNVAKSQVRTFSSITSFSDLPDNINWPVHLADWALRWTSKRYDWEGIHCNDDGSLYLASESLSAVAKIDPDGQARWITPSFSTEIQKQGFSSTLNTGFEGITANPEHILIALEREPRGLMRIAQQSPPPAIDHIQHIRREGVTSPLSADFTGLWLESNDEGQYKLYTLERNDFRVCRRNYENWVVEACWSYRDTEKAPEFRFANDRYGLAEGIARFGEHIYIVLDNNSEPRQLSGDKSPLLFQFKRPSNW